MTEIKICGMTRLEDALTAEGAGANAIGFVFAESPRCVSPERARRIARHLAPWTARVGVFVDDPPEKVREVARSVPLDMIQLHGEETREYLEALGFPAFKVFRARDARVLGEIREFGAEAFLLDAYSPRVRGGTGRCVNHALAERAGKLGAMVLAGGLEAGNVAEAILRTRPAGVDVSSGVETRPGRKDRGKLRAFISEVKRCDARMNGGTSTLSGAALFRRRCNRR